MLFKVQIVFLCDQGRKAETLAAKMFLVYNSDEC